MATPMDLKVGDVYRFIDVYDGDDDFICIVLSSHVDTQFGYNHIIVLSSDGQIFHNSFREMMPCNLKMDFLNG